MEFEDIPCDMDCEKVKKFKCEFVRAELTDKFVMEFPLDDNISYIYERMVLLNQLLNIYDHLLPNGATDIKFECKAQRMLGLLVVDGVHDRVMAAYYKSVPLETLIDVDSWILVDCSADLQKKGYLYSGKRHENFKFRLVAMAY